VSTKITTGWHTNISDVKWEVLLTYLDFNAVALMA